MKTSLRVIADQHIYQLQNHLPPSVHLDFFDPSLGLPNTSSYNALIVRTVTKLRADSIQQLSKSISFVGTASAGFDHVDLKALKQNNIHFASAAGSNAQAVAEYVLSSLLIWANKKSISLQSKSLGIIGVGHVGTKVHELATKLGIKTILYDPPREKRDSAFVSHSLDEVLDTDLLTFHVPYDQSTHHLFSDKLFKNQTFDLIVNAARGGIVDESFLLKQLDTNQILDCIIDCWENEPQFNETLLKRAFIASPHIAGYSEQAKINATKLIVDQLVQHVGIEKKKSVIHQEKKFISTDACKNEIDFIEKNHSVLNYHEQFLQFNPMLQTSKESFFSTLRTNTPYRFEYPFLSIDANFLKTHPILALLGIQSIDATY